MKPNVDEAAKLATTLNLRTVEFESLLAYPIEGAPPRASLDWELTPPTVKWSIADRAVTVRLPFTVALKAAGKAVYVVAVGIRSTYDVREEAEIPAARDVDHYVGISSVLHAWPYLRAQVQYLSTMLGMTPVVLPNIVASQLPDTIDVRRMRAGTEKKKK